MDDKSMMKREKRYLCIVTALGVVSGSYLILSLLYSCTAFLPHFLIAAAFAAALILIIRRHRAKTANSAEWCAPEEEMRRIFDRYTRRSINWLLIAFWEVFGLALSLITLGVNSKANEVVESLSGHLFFIGLISFFLIKNLLIVRWLNAHHTFENKQNFHREIRFVLVSSLIYWLIAVGLYYAFEKVFVLNISAFVTGIFTAWIILYNFTRINGFTYFKKRHNRAVIAALLVIALVTGGYTYLSRDIWLTQPYINSVPHLYDGESRIAYNDATGVYTVTKPEGDFKILQLTDIHLGGGVLSYDKDLKALEAVYALLEATRPDLVVVTGDMCFPVGFSSFSFNNTAPVQQFAAFMRNTGIPWAFTYGNHDTESYAASSSSTLDALYQSLSWKTSRTLLYPYIQPEITGRNNQEIERREQDGSLDYALFLIDSNAYTGEGLNKYDYIHDDQVAWYRSEVLRLNTEAGHTIPSLIFFHVPLQQYKTAYELYEQGSSEVTWFFGENNEQMMDKVCCSQYPSAIFDTANELGSTKGFFCGHDHYNNMSLEYQGIRLTYGMSIDYLAMPGIARDTAQRGATLIVLDAEGGMNISQVPLAAIQTEQ